VARIPSGVLPLKPADFHILMVLLAEDLHGYGIMQRVSEDSGGAVALELGSLYRVIGRLAQLGLIAETTGPRSSEDPRRRYYRITTLGREAARAEARRLVDVVRLAKNRELLDAPAR